jgi:hypothetical protein
MNKFRSIDRRLGFSSRRVIRFASLFAVIMLPLLASPALAAVGDLCANVPAVCPGASSLTNPVSAYNPTHYAQPVGTTATYQILFTNAADAPDFSKETTSVKCAIGQVQVRIDSSSLGNTVVCGTVDPTGKIITFQFTAPLNGCDTTNVKYKTGVDSTGNDLFNGANNDIIKDSLDNETPEAAAGIAYVSASPARTVALKCNSAPAVTTEIEDPDENVITSATVPITVHDEAAVTGPTAGRVSFTFFQTIDCTGLGSAAGTIPLVSGIADPSTSEVISTAGSYSFQAVYNGDPSGAFQAAVGPCEPLTVTDSTIPTLGEIDILKFCDANANGAIDPGEVTLSEWQIDVNSTPACSGVTNAVGLLACPAIAPGTYTVSESLLANLSHTANFSHTATCVDSICSSPVTDTGSVTIVGNEANNVSFGNVGLSTIQGTKFDDVVTPDGIQNPPPTPPATTPAAEPGMAGIAVTLTGTAANNTPVSKCTQTLADGSYSFPNLLPGSYTVAEVQPSGTIATTLTSCPFTLSPNATTCEGSINTCNFGNTCLGAGGGLTLGFWSNKNGQALETAADFTLLTSLNLVNANGSARNFTDTLAKNKTALNSWLLGASATNMAYMLSAQLTAMELNTQHPGVSLSAYLYAGTPPAACGNLSPTQPTYLNGFVKVSDLMTYGNSLLGSYAIAVATGNARICEEFVKTTLDNGNNNKNFDAKCSASVTSSCPVAP